MSIGVVLDVSYRTVKNISEFSYLDYMEENSLVNGLIMANGY